MEEYLEKFRPVEAPPGLRARVLEAATRTLADRFLRSGRFWLGIAAALVLWIGGPVVTAGWCRPPGPALEARSPAAHGNGDTLLSLHGKLREVRP